MRLDGEDGGVVSPQPLGHKRRTFSRWIVCWGEAACAAVPVLAVTKAPAAKTEPLTKNWRRPKFNAFSQNINPTYILEVN